MRVRRELFSAQPGSFVRAGALGEEDAASLAASDGPGSIVDLCAQGANTGVPPAGRRVDAERLVGPEPGDGAALIPLRIQPGFHLRRVPLLVELRGGGDGGGDGGDDRDGAPDARERQTREGIRTPERDPTPLLRGGRGSEIDLRSHGAAGHSGVLGHPPVREAPIGFRCPGLRQLQDPRDLGRAIRLRRVVVPLASECFVVLRARCLDERCRRRGGLPSPGPRPRLRRDVRIPGTDGQPRVNAERLADGPRGRLKGRVVLRAADVHDRPGTQA